MKKQALLIDAKNKILRPVLVGEYTDIYKHCGFDLFTCVVLENNEVLYVDDEGLINGTDFGFQITVGSEKLTIMGNGLILGCKSDGDSTDTQLKPDDLKITYSSIL